MALNPFFNKFNAENEQRLYQDLIVESISIWGHEIYYIPRNINNFHPIYATDDQSSYTKAIPCEVYVNSADGFDGRSDIFSKFGLQIQDNIVLTMALRTFQREIQPITQKSRPDEGDLIYFTLNKKCFQIKYTNNKQLFYPLGELPIFTLTLELFEYSDEIFATGIPEIDRIQRVASMNVLDSVITTEDGIIITDDADNRLTDESYDIDQIDPISDNDNFAADVTNLVDFSKNNPFGKMEE